MNTFIGEVNWVISLGGAWEGGLQVTREGIEFMKALAGPMPGQHERIRPDANLITIWVTDEESEWFQYRDINEAAAQQKLLDYIDFYRTHTTSFAIVGNPAENCGASEGVAYKEVARATGGSFASVCAQDVSETINEIIFAASAQAGNPMPETPISSSLRVFINGEWVPRSRENGFHYFESDNTIAFFGSYRSDLPQNGEAPSAIAVSYQTWQDRTKD